MATVAHAHRPVVLVRPDPSAPDPVADGTGEQAPVVAGIDLGPTTEGVLQFAFETAAVRSAGVEIQYCWNPPVGYVQGIGGDLRWHADIAAEGIGMVRSLLAPWSQEYPRVAVKVRCEIGSPARHLVDAGAHAPWSPSAAEPTVTGRTNHASGMSPTPSCTTPPPRSP